MTATVVLEGDYPRSWSAFIGQDQAKAQLLTAARSARKRKTRMDHRGSVTRHCHIYGQATG